MVRFTRWRRPVAPDSTLRYAACGFLTPPGCVRRLPSVLLHDLGIRAASSRPGDHQAEALFLESKFSYWEWGAQQARDLFTGRQVEARRPFW